MDGNFRIHLNPHNRFQELKSCSTLPHKNIFQDERLIIKINYGIAIRTAGDEAYVLRVDFECVVRLYSSFRHLIQ